MFTCTQNPNYSVHRNMYIWKDSMAYKLHDSLSNPLMRENMAGEEIHEKTAYTDYKTVDLLHFEHQFAIT